MQFTQGVTSFIHVLAALATTDAVRNTRNSGKSNKHNKTTTITSKLLQSSAMEDHTKTGSDHTDLEGVLLANNYDGDTGVYVSAVPLCNGVYIEVEVFTDSYPQETSWALVDNCRMGISKGQDFFENTFTVYTDSYCLPSGPYTFTIYDIFGDGRLCLYIMTGY